MLVTNQKEVKILKQMTMQSKSAGIGCLKSSLNSPFFLIEAEKRSLYFTPCLFSYDLIPEGVFGFFSEIPFYNFSCGRSVRSRYTRIC